MTIPVVDIFAGPGGLGEGFTAFAPDPASDFAPFNVALSAEMDVNAVKTLRLRAFFRQFAPGAVPPAYYDYVAGNCDRDALEAMPEWQLAEREALHLTLGKAEDNEELRHRIRAVVADDEPWVLVGGPPCQGYSLVGRVRNKGNPLYQAEEDERYFLYKQFVGVLSDCRPSVFVMENVRGILSARVFGERIFPSILDALRQPGGSRGPRYRVVPLMLPVTPDDEHVTDGRAYILRSEEFGVPQARHRVILLGVMEGAGPDKRQSITPSNAAASVADVIGGLPRLRSGVTDRHVDNWQTFATGVLSHVADVSSPEYWSVALELRKSRRRVRKRDPGQGGRLVRMTEGCHRVPPHLAGWLLDDRLYGLPNHEVRRHKVSDLERYAYAAAFARVHHHSPRGAEEFPAALHPDHKNWKSGKFKDRFRVQVSGKPSSTVTSHISKDGHYFIHPDPSQLRSLSVREAARLQTFPDNYFFEGPRGAQFHQVGNAVPSWLARQIAAVVYSIVNP